MYSDGTAPLYFGGGYKELGHFCLQDYALTNPFDKGVGYGQRGKLHLRLVMQGIPIQVYRISYLHDASRIYHRHHAAYLPYNRKVIDDEYGY